MSDPAPMLDTIRLQAAGCEGLGCPFYARLLSELGDRLGRPGTIAAFLAPYSDAPFAAAYPLRLLGGVHRLVLAGAEPAIAAHYPSVGGDGDAAGAARAIERLLGTPPPALVDAMRRPPQTNEVGRAAALASGLAVVARAYGRPIRLRELGSSGGLNLRLDSYWYEHEGAGWGTPASAVRFTGLWSGGGPPFGAGAEIVDRRGCDRDPIDVASVDGALTLLSYVWPEPSERFVRARAAMALARDTPVAVDRADIVAWLPKHVDQPRSGTALVVMHSVVWQYLDEATHLAVRHTLERVGARATPDAPVAWLRLEPHPVTYAPAELRLTCWDGAAEPRESLLATTNFHGGELQWHGWPPRDDIGAGHPGDAR